MIKRFILVIILLLSVQLFQVYGQQYHSSSKKAIKRFHEALKYFENNKGELALQFVNKAIKSDADFVEAYMMKSQILMDMQEFEPGIECYKKA